MAGADYGYVGAANGKVHIYRGTVSKHPDASSEKRS